MQDSFSRLKGKAAPLLAKSTGLVNYKSHIASQRHHSSKCHQTVLKKTSDKRCGGKLMPNNICSLHLRLSEIKTDCKHLCKLPARWKSCIECKQDEISVRVTSQSTPAQSGDHLIPKRKKH
ncbi:hypothetical protein MTO96_030391 [Rhipicephalus appendiculatus]